jgi:hypothetical protein
MAKLANLPWLAEVVFAIAGSALHFFVWVMANRALTMAAVAVEIVKERSTQPQITENVETAKSKSETN